MKTHDEIEAELERLELLDAAQNGQIYPADSLHADGAYSTTCRYCPAIAALRWVLGWPDRYPQGDVRATADLTAKELARLARLADARLERSYQPDAKINNW